MSDTSLLSSGYKWIWTVSLIFLLGTFVVYILQQPQLMAHSPMSKKVDQRNAVKAIPRPQCKQCSCNDTQAQEYKVPNIVHYFWYADKKKPLTFKHYLGVLSAHKVLKPEKILFHTNVNRSAGKYWDQIMSLSTVKAVKSDPPRGFGKDILVTDKTAFPQDYSDIARIQCLMEYGGIYLDFDTVVIRPLDEFRKKYEFTLGQTQDGVGWDLLGNGLIISAKRAAFLYVWANSFVEDYRPKNWSYNSVIKTTKLWKRFPELLHTEPTKFLQPNWRRLEVLWGNETFKWRDNYTVHLYWRLRSFSKTYRKLYGGLDPNETHVYTMNNTFAEIAKYILHK